jgi:outer membrane protein insertion porin family
LRWLTPFIALGFVSTSAVSTLAQIPSMFRESRPQSPSATPAPVLERIELIGLQRIAPQAVLAQVSLRPGDRFDTAKLQNDVHALGRLGWFDSIRVDEISPTAQESQTSASSPRVTLLFFLKEQPLLARVEYSGSRLLASKEIEKMLDEQKLKPSLGKPADPAALQRVAQAIRSNLVALAHPEASVSVQRQTSESATVAVRFVIDDGPHVPVRRVRFSGEASISEKQLRDQMQAIAPWKPLAFFRGKNAYSAAAFEDDRRRILAYYRDHGYPEARVGNARVAKTTDTTWRPFPFPHRAPQTGFLLTIPVQAGPYYQLDSINPTQDFRRAVESHTGKPLLLPAIEQDHDFSQQEVDKLRRSYSALLQSRTAKTNSAAFSSVEATPLFDSENHSVRVMLALSDSPPFIVHRLEFQGLHKFSDRYVRRRIPLREGHPLDEHALEAGLTSLSRTSYFKPIHKENVHIQFDDARRTADVVVRLEEIGQQRATFEGGRAQFGNTLGLVYTVFDLFSREELLSAKLDGGPQSLQIALSIAKEGIFGTRGTLAFSVFDNVIRPHLIPGVQGPFPASHSVGVNIPYSYALTNVDSLGLSYTLSRTTSDLPLGTAPGTTDLPPIDLRTHTTSHALTTSLAHDTGNERFLFSNSASGGVLGGDEHMVRSSAEAARILHDPLFASTNSWAFRTTFNAAGSYRGDAPFYSRFFPGDEFVRGLRTGDLGPIAMTEHATPSGAFVPSPSPAGANLIAAANAEYRIPLRGGAEAAGFFDLGSGWLLPNWLGPSKPTLLSATNGVLHGSTGVELRWTIPEVQVPVRAYYSVNVLRLDRFIPLSAKSLLHAHNRFAAFGWGFGSLF